uniref:Uncharacterized protein n=1 Tax=Ananas comosus var. bracteatus TaxID=296719 RepID=A0A6V7P6G1_ANACO|nr:unnamed protein product [Ananas comosus var. bracteatus]
MARPMSASATHGTHHCYHSLLASCSSHSHLLQLHATSSPPASSAAAPSSPPSYSAGWLVGGGCEDEASDENGGVEEGSGESCVEVGGRIYRFISGDDDSCIGFDGIAQALNGLNLNMKRTDTVDIIFPIETNVSF